IASASVISLVAYRRRTLTVDGAVAAAGVGAIVFARMGLRGAGALLAFFISSSALSRLSRPEPGGFKQAKGARRDASQVLANGGVATVCAFMGWRSAFVGALATAAADTWATEIGMRFGGTPRLVTTLRRVEAGTSGGMTLAGLLASLGGAATVSAVWSVLGGGAAALKPALIAGVAGALADSLLGATAQGLYRCSKCGALLESVGTHEAELLRGSRWVNNDVVNAGATLIGAVFAAALSRIHRTRRSR
ncbi:MAG: DUF92 domain-containing protein, partial [Chloroflexi bacterium]|nr:DUF92 domain-containing protein [Chloroflexota bacterium]